MFTGESGEQFFSFRAPDQHPKSVDKKISQIVCEKNQN